MKKTNLNCFLPAFKDYSGHENSYLKVFEKFSKVKNLNVELFVAKNNKIQTTLKKKNFFLTNNSLFLVKFVNIFRNFLIISKINRLCKKETIFLIDGYSFYFLFSFVLSLNNFGKFKKIIIFCRYNHKGFKKIIFKFFLLILNIKFSKCILITDNNLNYQAFKKDYKKNNIRYFPTPFFYKKRGTKNLKKIRKTILCPGQYRVEKFGKNLINFLEKNKNSKIQVAISKKFKNIIFGKIKFKKFEENLKKEKYFELIKNNSIIILPYDEKLYRYRTSGIFFESIQYNKLIFVTKNTWFSKELKKFKLNELVINDWSEFNLDKKLTELQFIKVRNKLDLMKKKYLKFHNQHNFVKMLKKICEK